MVAVYSKEQINEIGVLFADEITKQGLDLKDFVKAQIEALEPVSPSEPTNPETGGGTVTNGVDGKSAYQLAVDNGYTGTQAEWLVSLKGEKGADGIGVDGLDGKSAYEIAKANGFVGTETEWLASLKGKDATGGGTSTGGMFLDDGREIKQRFITGELHASNNYLLLETEIPPEKVLLSYDILVEYGTFWYKRGNSVESGLRFATAITAGSRGHQVTINEIANGIKGKRFKAIFTYLS